MPMEYAPFGRELIDRFGDAVTALIVAGDPTIIGAGTHDRRLAVMVTADPERVRIGEFEGHPVHNLLLPPPRTQEGRPVKKGR